MATIQAIPALEMAAYDVHWMPSVPQVLEASSGTSGWQITVGRGALQPAGTFGPWCIAPWLVVYCCIGMDVKLCQSLPSFDSFSYNFIQLSFVWLYMSGGYF